MVAAGRRMMITDQNYPRRQPLAGLSRSHIIPTPHMRIRKRDSPVVLKKFLQAKLHGVRVTETRLDYEGSCGIDPELLEASGLREFQHIDIYSVTTGARFSTYIIRGTAGTGEISLNGAAARQVQLNDVLIIAAYSLYSDDELRTHEPRIVLVDENNRPKRRPGG